MCFVNLPFLLWTSVCLLGCLIWEKNALTMYILVFSFSIFIQILGTGFLIIFLNLGKRQQGDMRYCKKVKWHSLHLIVVGYVVILFIWITLGGGKIRSLCRLPPTTANKQKSPNKKDPFEFLPWSVVLSSVWRSGMSIVICLDVDCFFTLLILVMNSEVPLTEQGLFCVSYDYSAVHILSSMITSENCRGP